jgi:hypothetical protein
MEYGNTAAPEPLEWPRGKKHAAMQGWAQVVMADRRLSKNALRVAWCLSFAFNSEDARAWLTKANIAKETRQDVSTVKGALHELETNGHIRRVLERQAGKMLRIFYPTLSRSIDWSQPLARRGGMPKQKTEVQAPGGTEVQSVRGTEVQAPCILESSLKNPRRVQDLTPGDGSLQAKKGFRKEADNQSDAISTSRCLLPLDEDDDDGELPRAPYW